ncbi:hypothetical protein [Zobellella taiwanensis]
MSIFVCVGLGFTPGFGHDLWGYLMAVHKPIDGILKNRDIRILRVFSDRLFMHKMVGGIVRWDTAERYIFEINKVLLACFPDVFERDRFIRDELNWCRSHLVSKNDVSWIENDDKACVWLWLVRVVLGYRVPSDDCQNNYARTYNHSELGFTSTFSPFSHKERVSMMVEYLDRISGDTAIRNKVIADLRRNWTIVVNSRELLKWVDRDDEEQCEWLWGCLKKELVPYLFSGGVNNPFPAVNLLPVGSSEMYLFSYAVFYAWQGAGAEKELFVRKIKNAWGQKKFRKKKAAKRSINTYIDPVVGKKLDELVFHYDLSIHRTIEMLIKKEYERLKGKGV